VRRVDNWLLLQQALSMAVDNLLEEGLPSDARNDADVLLILAGYAREVSEELVSACYPLVGNTETGTKFLVAELLKRLLAEKARVSS
jgi:hypothetical protein